MSGSWSTKATPSKSSTPPCPGPSRWALRAPATPSGSMPSCTASGTPCSSAMPPRFAPWSSAKRRPMNGMLGTLDLLRHERFPTVWVPDPATRDLRALLTHRRRLVRIQTMLKNGLHAIALNQRLVRGAKLLRQAGVAQLRALPLPPYTAQRRDHSLELLETLHTKIQQLDAAIATAARAHPDAPRLLTHPGVGPLTALTTVVVLGPVTRFADAKHVVSYVGLAPSLHASADKYRLGHITKQGSSLLRWVLGQAAPNAARIDADLKRTYCTLRHRRGHAKAKVAVTRKLLVRLFIMLRDQIDYAEFRRRGRPPAPVLAG